MSNAGGFKSLNRYYDMLAGNTVWNPWEPDGAYDALSTVTVGATAVSSITFAGIPNTYKHLQVRILQMTSGTINPKLKINNDGTGSNYYMHSIYNNNPNVSAYNEANNASGISYLYNETTQPAVAIIDILDYASTTKNKTLRDLGAYDANGSGYIFYRSGGWFSTAAINSLTFTEPSNFLQHTQFSLYGVK
jgi:hypothetical protein